MALKMVSRPHRDSCPKAEARSADGRAPEDRWRTPTTERSEGVGVPNARQWKRFVPWQRAVDELRRALDGHEAFFFGIPYSRTFPRYLSNQSSDSRIS